MTQVSFYTGVPDRLAYVCRLLRKAQQSGARVGVLGAPATLERLDSALWTFEATDFVPHVRCQSGNEAIAAVTPLVLAQRLDDLSGCPVLLNLSTEVPAGIDQFERVLEVLGRAPEQVQLGRERFRFYKSQGYALSHHDVSQQVGE